MFGQKIVNDILKDIEIKIDWIDGKGFVTSVCIPTLFNMDDNTFKNKYLNANSKN